MTLLLCASRCCPRAAPVALLALLLLPSFVHTLCSPFTATVSQPILPCCIRL